jgi:xylan 1,4-beta-xylosidase
VRGEPDVGAFASVSDDGGKLFVFLWHYHDNNLHFPDVAITATARNVPGVSKAGEKVKLTHWRIDNDHSNSYEAWVRMGSPQPPSQTQLGKLVKAGKLAMLHRPKTIRASKDGSFSVRTTLPIRGTSLLVLEKA